MEFANDNFIVDQSIVNPPETNTRVYTKTFDCGMTHMTHDFSAECRTREEQSSHVTLDADSISLVGTAMSHRTTVDTAVDHELARSVVA